MPRSFEVAPHRRCEASYPMEILGEDASATAQKVNRPSSRQMYPYAPKGFAPTLDPGWEENARRIEQLVAQRDRAEHGGLCGTLSRTPARRRATWAAAGATLLTAVVLGAALGTTLHRRGAAQPTGPKAFADSFATVPASWRISQDHSNGGAYACGFAAQAVTTPGAFAALSVLQAPASGSNHSCAQLQNQQTFEYGSYSVQLQAARGLGVVTAFFTYVETSASKNQEIDIEFTGADTTVLWASSWRDGQNFTQALPLGFDAAAAAHNYSFVWQPDAVVWLADGQELLRHTDSQTLPQKAPTNLFVSTWLRQPNSWVGNYDPAAPLANNSTTSLFAISYQS